MQPVPPPSAISRYAGIAAGGLPATQPARLIDVVYNPGTWSPPIQRVATMPASAVSMWSASAATFGHNLLGEAAHAGR